MISSTALALVLAMLLWLCFMHHQCYGSKNKPDGLMLSVLADPENYISTGDAGARYIEIYNPTSKAIDLGSPAPGYALRIWRQNSASDSPSDTEYLTGTIQPKGFYVVTNSAAKFSNDHGFDANQGTSATGVASANGDDTIALLNPSGKVIDIFGVPGVDSSTTDYHYKHGKAESSCSRKPSATFNKNEWHIQNEDIGPSLTSPDHYDPRNWCQ